MTTRACARVEQASAGDPQLPPHFAGLAAYVSVRFLVRWFSARTLTPFGVYCLVAGVVCIIRFA